jgi:broad specificity phosphatase PhoE
MSNNIYLTRHLPRVDAGLQITSLEMTRKWASDSSDINNKHNPYLSDNIGSYIDTLTGNLVDKNINVIISSPFLRCIQTALKIKELTPKITKIYIDYGLSELISDFDFDLTNDSLDIEAIYQHSLTKLSEEEKSYLEVLNRTHSTIQNENENDFVSEYPYPKYYSRIRNTVDRINDTNTDKNILLVSHAYSSNTYQKPDLAYSQVVKIEPTASSSSASGGNSDDKDFKMKYLKYKMKYLELKKMKYLELKK